MSQRRSAAPFFAWLGVSVCLSAFLVLFLPLTTRTPLDNLTAILALFLGLTTAMEHRALLRRQVAIWWADMRGHPRPSFPAEPSETPADQPPAKAPETKAPVAAPAPSAPALAVPEVAKATAAKPVVKAATAEEKHAEAIQLLSLLQEKGRLLDFLMEDISRAQDAQVGAAARVVHEGCRELLGRYFKIEPVHEAAENSLVKLPKGYAVGDYRLSGKFEDRAQIEGYLRHHGWKLSELKLPELKRRENGQWPPLAPAQIEVK